MTQPVPEEHDETLDLTEPPPDEHDSDLPDDEDGRAPEVQEENAESALDQPSDGTGGG